MTIPAPVQAVIDAANRGDTASFLACFSDDGVVNDWGREFHGAAEIASWSDAEFIGVDVKLDVTSGDSSQSTVTVTAQVGGSGFTGESHFVFTINHHRIRLMRITA